MIVEYPPFWESSMWPFGSKMKYDEVQSADRIFRQTHRQLTSGPEDLTQKKKWHVMIGRRIQHCQDVV